MAQPQQQFPMPPQRPFSPPQGSPSPATPQPFQLPPTKRQRLSPNPPSQPESPYVQSPYTMSPGASAPQSTGTSPHFTNIQLPPNVYNTPYSSNGPPTPTLSLPQAQPNTQNLGSQSPLNFPIQSPVGQQPSYNYMMAPQGGTMGPPSRPMDKKEDGVDPMDVLGGTGVDLREEEQYTFQMYDSSFNSQQLGSHAGAISASHSFTQFPPGDEASFYGAGPANAAEEAQTKSQNEHIAKAAEKAWRDAAHNLAVSRQRELNNPFLVIGTVHQKMDKIARENGIGINLDASGKMGTMKLPGDFPSPTVTAQTVVGPDGAITTTQGTFLPHDSLLVDQLALLSIATKHRLRGMIEDAAVLAKGRQTSSHGIVPEEWADVAAPSKTAHTSYVAEGAPRTGWESAASPGSNPRKRTLSVSEEGIKTPGGLRYSNEVVAALRASALKEREHEEARLLKRANRANRNKGGDASSRQGSVAPGTPGSVAPEMPEKAPTKKEQKRKAEAKVNEAASHAAANVTTAQFLGGGTGLFGKKKKYSWMTGSGGGSTASGASTPGRIITQGLPGTPAGGMAAAVPERLTADGVRRLGTWREDKEKGKGIQIREWILVLERDGREKRALQKAYAWLDQSEPK